MPLHLGLADVAVSAKRSASEANGKLLNYMAMGLPTVAYETPVSRELLGERGTYALRETSPRWPTPCCRCWTVRSAGRSWGRPCANGQRGASPGTVSPPGWRACMRA